MAPKLTIFNVLKHLFYGPKRQKLTILDGQKQFFPENQRFKNKVIDYAHHCVYPT
jgi:hypothetical protein